MVGLVARWFRWGLFLGALGAISGCGMAQLSSLEEPMDGTLISTPDQEGSSAPEDEDRSVPPEAQGSSDADDGDGSDGADADSSVDEDQDDPETPAVDTNPPIAYEQVLGTPMNTALSITLSASDSDEDPLTYAIVDGPTHGVLNGSPPAVTYVPGDACVGFDSFSFQADSGRPSGASDTAVVRIWVIDEQDLSGQTVTGVLETPSDIDAWVLEGTAGQRVLITLSSRYPSSSTLSLYAPGGGGAEVSTQYDRIDWQLQMSGQYTVTVEDYLHNDGGYYDLTLLNLAGQLASLADLDGGPIESGETLPGQLNSASDIDAFTFEGAAGQRVLITVSSRYPSSSTLSLYPPGGGGAEVSTQHDWIDRQLQMSGRYTITIEDYLRNDGGSYSLALQKF